MIARGSPGLLVRNGCRDRRADRRGRARTDTGGSVRVPAALNGSASLRPTSDAIAAGIAPISHTRDTAGPMAATMADVALLDASSRVGTRWHRLI